jgi:hypothetical protein
MRSSRLLSIIAVAIGLIILGAVFEARAGIWLPKSEMSSNLANGSSGLVVEIKKKKHHEDNDENSQPAKSQSDCKPGTCFGCGGAFAGCSCHKVYCEDGTPPKESTGPQDYACEVDANPGGHYTTIVHEVTSEASAREAVKGGLAAIGSTLTGPITCRPK